jgi:Lytic polysaccharide mono-oxygenase, cellulose-degrading
MARPHTHSSHHASLARRVAVFCLALGGSAEAHITLVSPPPRYAVGVSTNANKSCPCGVGTSNRICDVPAEFSDPDRSVNVTPLVAGEMITFQFKETIDHTGRFRIAIDYDGADVEDFNSNILLDVTDPPGGMGNTGNGNVWELTIQVPDMPCTNCTLQLIQDMNNKPDVPVMDPSKDSTYYQCADITISSGATPAGSTTAPATSASAPRASASAAPSVAPSSTGAGIGLTSAPASASAPAATAAPSAAASASVNPATSSSAPAPAAGTGGPSAVPSAPAVPSAAAPPTSSAAPATSSTGVPIDAAEDDDGGGGCSVVTIGQPTSFAALLAALGLGFAAMLRGRRR